MSGERNPEVANEGAVEQRYAALLSERLNVRHARRRNESRGRVVDLPQGSLVGRVLLRRGDALLDGERDFYIGDRHIEQIADGLRVFSWSAPVAALFFGSAARSVFAWPVSVRRTFVHEKGRLSGLSDESAVPGQDDSFPLSTLTVPAAPRAVPLPRRTGDGEGARSSGAPGREAPLLRARSTLVTVLERPRQRELTPVLSTLQADQYDHVTAKASEARILMGGPGTGKSIIASHRAVYLTTSDAMNYAGVGNGTVLLVGPTPGYVDHVRGVTSALSPGNERLNVIDVPTLLDRVANLPRPSGDHPSELRDTERALLVQAAAAYQRLRAASPRLPGRGTETGVAAVYDALRQNRVGTRALVRDDELSKRMRALPPWESAKTARAQRALVAGLHLVVGAPNPWSTVAHVVVDEAQDLTDVEWEVLRLLNTGEQWTLVGDLNQRRSPRSTVRWSDVSVTLLGSPDALAQVELPLTYRSTAAILDYANRLLPPALRSRTALRSQGIEPQVIRALRSQLAAQTVHIAEKLCQRYPDGTVAVIAGNPVEVRDYFTGRGWKRDGAETRTLKKEGHTVQVLSPFAARGLEFDAVLVHEPSEITEEGSEHGQLYTSLTRANKELRVIHVGPLPQELRGARAQGHREPAAAKRLTQPEPAARPATKTPLARPALREGRCLECQQVVPLLTAGSSAAGPHDFEGAPCGGAWLLTSPVR